MSGAKLTMKKCRRGKGIRLTASLRRSEFSCPGKRRQQVTPIMVALIKWFRSPTAEETKEDSHQCKTARGQFEFISIN